MNVRRISLLSTALALAAAPIALGANPPRGSHGQETDTPAAITPPAYSRAVSHICAHAPLFTHEHSIGTRKGAMAVAGDIRASTQRRLVWVAALPTPPAQQSAVVRWLALERRLADAHAMNYVRLYDLIARGPSQQERGAARRLAGLMRAPDRLRRAAARLEQQLRVPDCTGG
jgi:hypothetical protein